MTSLARLRDGDAPDRRAQLVLAGAVIIAAVIIGLTLLVNSILYTETVGSESVNSRVDEAKISDFEFRKGARSLVLRVNHDGRNVTAADIRGDVRRNVSLYSHLLAEAHATGRPLALNLSYHIASTALGLRIVQGKDATMAADDGGIAWNPVPGSQPWRVGWFTMNVNLSETTKKEFLVRADNGSETLQLEFEKTANGTLQVNQTGTLLASERSTECDPSSGRVLLDVYDGSAFTGDCSFVGTDVLAGADNDDTYSLRFEKSDNLVGKFGIVTNASASSPPGIASWYPPCSAPGAATPCRMPVVWRANVTTTIVSEELAYDNQYNISIYARNR